VFPKLLLSDRQGEWVRDKGPGSMSDSALLANSGMMAAEFPGPPEVLLCRPGCFNVGTVAVSMDTAHVPEA